MAELVGENVKETNGRKRRNTLHSVMLRKSKGSYSGRNQGKINPLNAKLNPTCPLLALLGTHRILHRQRDKNDIQLQGMRIFYG